jgi:hypothetical protein
MHFTQSVSLNREIFHTIAVSWQCNKNATNSILIANISAVFDRATMQQA